MKTQRESVFTCVCAMLGRTPEKGEVVKFEKDDLKVLHQLVVADFMTGEVELKESTNGIVRDEAWLKKYVPGLCNNWLRKDTRLNGGNKYETKNPGSRTGSGDEELKNAKNLLAIVKDPQARADIQTFIDQKLAAIAEAKKPVIAVDKLPEHLRKYVATAAVAPVIRKS